MLRAIAPRERERVHLHGVVDDEVRRQLRVDPRGIATEVAHRVAHRGEVDDGRHAREILVEDARGREAQLAGRLVGRHPAGDCLDVGIRARAQRVLEQDPQRERQPLDVVCRLKRVQAEDLVASAAGPENVAHAIDSSRTIPSGSGSHSTQPSAAQKVTRKKRKKPSWPSRPNERFHGSQNHNGA